jgi:uncharacterized protein with HEPN domain
VALDPIAIGEFTSGTVELRRPPRQSRGITHYIRNLSVIGEAASRVPPDVISRYPGIPWALMRGIRNVLVHEYFGVSLQVIWDTANEDLPPLAEQLRRVLDENP